MIMIGDSGVGKTCLIRQFTQNIFSDHYQMTIGMEFESKDISVDNQDIQL